MSFTYGKRVSCYILFVPAIDSSSTYVAGHSEDSHSQSQDNICSPKSPSLVIHPAIYLYTPMYAGLQ